MIVAISLLATVSGVVVEGFSAGPAAVRLAVLVWWQSGGRKC
jgi:hypothetical protein